MNMNVGLVEGVLGFGKTEAAWHNFQ